MENYKRFYPAIIVTVVLIVVAAGGTLLIVANIRNEARQSFVSAVDSGIGEIDSDIKSDKSDTASIAQSYIIAAKQARASQTDYQPRLKLLYDNINRRDLDMTMVGVALRVAEANRAVYEQTMSADFARQVSITVMDTDGSMKPDSARNEYYPITFVEPQLAAAEHIGMNIATEKPIEAAMKQTAETGFPAVSGTMDIIEGAKRTTGYCVLAPITEISEGDNPTQTIGFVIEYNSFDNLIKAAAGQREGFSGIALFDSAAPLSAKAVATAGAGFNKESVLSALVSNPSNYVKTINLKRHTWTIVALPNPIDPVQIWQLAAIVVANAAFIILIAMYMFSSVSRSLKLEQVEADLTNSNKDLSAWAVKSEQRTFELTMLREMSDMLQTCDSTSEAFLVMSLFMYKFFMPFSGAIYMLDVNRETAEIKVTWGANAPTDKVIGINDCIALRRSEIYSVDDVSAEPICDHAKNPATGGYICLPMMSQGETFGLFYLASVAGEGPRLDTDEYVLATTVSEQLAMTIANITLRERLRELSLTDHLTKLFNRRYMEEMLDREVRRADRNGLTIGFIMFDIDFFKNINDSYGHDAGDRVLETLGIFLKTSVRAEDIACRYGGEEFLLVMPGSDKKNTVKRAVEIIEKVQLLTIEDDGHSMPPIHLSGGVAVYPDDMKDKDGIIVRADAALYEAKRTGRNKVVVWSDMEK
jgi:diguanylate cyclase (GGDEF)-like protein